MSAVATASPRIVVELPLRTVSLKNVREHWARRAKRTKEQRAVVRMRLHVEAWGGCRLCNLLGRYGIGGPPRLTVTLIRIAERALDVGDNLSLALSAVRDGVADALGIDDGDPRVEYRYAQEKPKKRGAVGVRIEIKPRGDLDQ